MDIDNYINDLCDFRKKRILLVVNYIRENYITKESMDYGPKTKFPMFTLNGIYVCIANMKNHISIHFGKYNATKIVANNNPKIITRVGCVNIKDSIDFPIDDIKKAIDYCYDSTL